MPKQRHGTPWSFVATLAVCIALGATSVEAQSVDAKSAARAVACLDTVSLTPSKQMLVYLRAGVADSADTGFAQMADLFTQSASQHLRQLLHGKGSVLPRGEPAVTWRHIESHPALGVTVHREGPPTFRLLSPRIDSVAGALLLRAAHDAQAAGDGTFWPGETPGDSARFVIEFALPTLGQAFPYGSARVAFPTFSVMFPPFSPVTATGTSAPADPFAGSQLQPTGEVVTDFEVDSTGHVDPSTISEVWPVGKERPTGQALATYNAFLKSVMRWLPTATFIPARIGGCPIRQRIREPITFGVSQ
jgi:hypothetical protein